MSDDPLSLLPRAIWTWTTAPPHGRRVQIWVDAEGHQIEYDVDVSDLTPLPEELEFDFRPIVVGRTTTPTLDEVALATLLIQCRG